MTACIPATNAINTDGYVYESRNGIRQGAHRWAYIDKYGPIPPGLHVCHTCDFRPCINPDHLFLGTNAINQNDKKLKGRASRGEHRPNAVLTEDLIKQIRKSNESSRFLARKFQVHRATISRVKSGQIWTHV